MLSHLQDFQTPGKSGEYKKVKENSNVLPKVSKIKDLPPKVKDIMPTPKTIVLFRNYEVPSKI